MRPDGEEYFITALMFAANRWGNGEGIYNYMAEANAILENSWNKPDVANYPFSDVKPLFDKQEKQVVFVPFATSATKTDPSYHLPAFYLLWAKWADNHNDFYTQLAAKSREMFPKFAHATTGLMPDYANFDGTPNGEGGHNNFRYDAWRCMMNMGVDYAWFGECQDEITLVKRAHNFFIGKGVKDYYSNYTLEGNQDSGNSDHSPGLVACNAVAVLASDTKAAWDFVDDFWETAIPSGRYRYYDGMLYFLGFLNASGNFRIYKPLDTTSISQVPVGPAESEYGGVNCCYELYSSSGKLLQTTSIRPSVDHFAPGIYLIRVTSDNGTVKTYKVIRNKAS